ncbi:MAG TPA: hypothetical protein K8V54_05225 [Corynebacterium kroppenstedtii]|nr:hypothetical protein [Corynebacterium kroppenstedtii]
MSAFSYAAEAAQAASDSASSASDAASSAASTASEHASSASDAASSASEHASSFFDGFNINTVTSLIGSATTLASAIMGLVKGLAG